ncbi:MAG: antibiotic biosynthesis monooxygenase [Actinobacteria bacterium]|nr:antibiotic biosynthesis monooxygenase [Actinomycetota bacterium]
MTVVQGVTEIRCPDRSRLLEVMEEDYRYLLEQKGFISGRLVESKADPNRFFHITEWASEDDFARLRGDLKVLEILEGLPPGTEMNSTICRPALVAVPGSGVTAPPPEA